MLPGLGAVLLGLLLSALIGQNVPLPASSMLNKEAPQVPDEAARVSVEPASISSVAAAPEASER
jgi:hypothetical protein